MLEKPDALKSLDEETYAQLRRLAAYYMRIERAGHTLQPTALVHEAYLRVYGGSAAPSDDPRHVLYTLVRAMREILIDHARRRAAAKRTRPEWMAANVEDNGYTAVADVLSMNSALDELSEFNSRRAKVVELRYYAGFTEEEVAHLLGVSRETVKLDWRFAKAWLSARLSQSRR